MSQRVLTVNIGRTLTMAAETNYRSKKLKMFGAFTMATPENFVSNKGIVADGEVIAAFAEEFRARMRENNIKAKRIVFCVNSKVGMASEEEIKSYEVFANVLQMELWAMDYSDNAHQLFSCRLNPTDTIATLSIGIDQCIMTVCKDNTVIMQKTSGLGLMDSLVTISGQLASDKNSLLDAVEAVREKNFFEINDAPIHAPEITAAFNQVKEETEEEILDASGKKFSKTGINPVGGFSVTGNYTESGDYTATGSFDESIDTTEADIIESELVETEETEAEVLLENPNKNEFSDIDFTPAFDSPLYTQLEQDMSMLVSSISKMLELYASENSDNPIDAIYVMGQGSDMLGLDDYLTLKLKKKVQWLAASGFGESNDERHYSAILGAVIDPALLSNENNIESEYELEIRRRNRRTVFAIIINAVLVGAAVFFLWYGFSHEPSVVPEKHDVNISLDNDSEFLPELLGDDIPPENYIPPADNRNLDEITEAEEAEPEEVTETDATEETETEEVTDADVTEETEIEDVTDADATEETETEDVTDADATEETEIEEVTDADVTEEAETEEITEADNAEVVENEETSENIDDIETEITGDGDDSEVQEEKPSKIKKPKKKKKKYEIYYTTCIVKVRKGPGVQHDVCGYVRKGEPVRVYEDTGWGWFRVRYKGDKSLYITTAYMEKRD